MRHIAFVAAAIVAAGPAHASPLTIDFETLAFEGGEFAAIGVGPSVTESGFTLTTDNTFFASLALLVFGDANPQNADPGGATLVVNRPLSTVTLTRDVGGGFDFLGFSAALIRFFAPEDGGTVAVFFDGDAAAATSFALAPGLDLQSFDFVGKGVTSVSFSSPDIDFFQLDDLRLDVPAPGALALFGLAAAALLGRKHARAWRR